MSAAAAVVLLGSVAACGSGQDASAVTQDSPAKDEHEHDHDHDGEGKKSAGAVAADKNADAHDDHDDHDHDEKPEPAEKAEDDGHGHAEGEEGDEEGAVHLTPAQMQAAGIEVVSISLGGGAETRLSGRVTPMIDARAAVGASVNGLIERVLVAPGDSVKAGQPLVIVISGDAAAVRADVDAARALAQASRQALQRSQNLYDQGIVARQEVEALTAESASADAVARAAEARAAAAGKPDASGRLRIVSPISGVVSSVQVGPGGFLAQGSVVAEVTNPERVELVFSAPPLLVSSAKVGSTMRVTGPAGEFNATVTGIAADAGAGQSGAAIVRARAEGGKLLPSGSPVTGSIVTGGSDGGILVPSDAVQTVNGSSAVFVQTKEGFKAVPVLLGRQASGRTEIVKGLTGSEKIAGKNAFLLKAELAKGEADHAH
ncbi:MAG TPA: efflux RND transporter periplasmic adaptor subunit [Hyphomonas sp.]|nr:efflux RND transporter periplasmic adaptor subunit [Hyphomonas sp.]HAY05058.1 efflux RND transporter periplasmic adaptor subunit [Hyphomonas sp.]HRI99504.1 efflux RND transporter periplasmic adaptor subunit [Hyphomonas sp.]HRK65916.1 efflux RND transporter periplasmic adaptor subunit [Hyphomonas sp.]